MSDVLVHHGWTKVMPEKHTYVVEVAKVIWTTLEVDALDPKHAAEIAELDSTPLPPYDEWELAEEWSFFVYDEDHDELLYSDDN